MPKAIANIERKIKELQRAPDNVKTRWLVGACATAMIFVIGFWVIYMNATLPKIEKKSQAAETADTTNKKDGTGEVFFLGLRTLTDDFKTRLEDFKNQVGQNANAFKKRIEKTNEFSLEGGQSNFQSENADEISPTPLP